MILSEFLLRSWNRIKTVLGEFLLRLLLKLFLQQKMASKLYVNKISIIFIGKHTVNPMPRGLLLYEKLIGCNAEFTEEEKEIEKSVRAVVIIPNYMKRSRTIVGKYIFLKNDNAEKSWEVLVCILFVYYRKFGRRKLLDILDKLISMNGETYLISLKEYFQNKVIKC